MTVDRKTKSARRSPRVKGVEGNGHSSIEANGKHPWMSYEHIPVGVVQASLAGKYLDANAEFCRISGYSRREVLRRGIRDCTHEDDYGLDNTLYEQLITGKIPFYRLEKRFVRKGGSVIWVELTRTLVCDAQGRPTHTVGVVLDISERKDVERVLRESVERLRLATESARMFMWELDLKDQIYTFADSFEQVLGFSGGLLPKNSVAEVQRLSPAEDVQALSDAITQAIETHRDLRSVKYRVIDPETGQMTWLEVNGKPVYDEKGKAVRFFGVAQNITESKKAQDQIAIISRMPAENPNPVMRVTPDGHILYANPASSRLVEDWQQDWGPGASLPPPLEQAVARAFHSREKIELEIEHRAAFYALTLAAVYEAGYINVYGKDITEEKKAELALRRSESNLWNFLENAAIGIHWVDRNGIIIWANQAELDMLGYTKEEYVGQAITGFHVDEPVIEDVLTRLGQGDTLDNYEVRLRHKDGSIRYGIINSNVLWENGEFIHTRCFTRDITERKRAEEKLRKSEERFRAIVSQATAGITESDREGRLIFANPRFCEMLGYSAEDLAGKSIWELTYPEDTKANQQLFEKLISDGEAYQLEKRLLHRNGAALWTNVSVSPIRDLNGTPGGGVGVILDIQERKKAEEALTEYARQQAALYKLSDQLHRTGSRQDVFEAALDAILSALQCHRASILLYDDKDVMRFVAWRGLSEEYRNATDGHSPWTPDVKDPRPILMEDIATADLDETLHAIIRNEGIRALAFIPLVAEGKLIGKFMIYFNEPHPFDEAEVDLSLTIAYQLASGLERKRAEAELRQSEERFRQAANASGALVYEVDLVSGSSVIVHGLERLTGYGPHEVNASSDWWHSLIHPEDLPAHLVQLDELFRKGGTDVSEYCIRHKNGDWIFLQDNRLVISDEMGRPIRLVGAVIDITERKQAEESLRASEQRFRDVFETAGVSVWVEDFSEVKAALDGLRARGVDDIRAYLGEHPEFVRQAINKIRIVDVNAETLELFGADNKADLLHSLEHIFTSETAPAFVEELAALYEGRETLRAEAPLRTLNGRSISVLLTVHFGPPAGHYRRVVVTLTDITERREAEQRLNLLADVSELLRNGDDPYEMMHAISRALGQHLKVRRVLFNEIDLEHDREIVHRDFHNGVDSAAGVHRLSDYSSVTSQEVASGKTVVNIDSRTDPRTAADYERIYALSGERAYVVVPMMRESRWVASLWVSDDTPRAWTQEDVSLIETVAERTWTIIEKLRIDRALRESEQRFREIFETAGVSVWVADFTAVQAAIEELRAAGVQEFRTYFAEHRDFVLRAASLIKVQDVNTETIEVFEAGSRQQLLDSAHELFVPETEPFFVEELVALAEGRQMVRGETQARTLGGKLITVWLTVHFGSLSGEQSRVVITLTDITERKRSEDTLRIRARQQQAVARLGELALRERDVQKVFDHATRTVAETLEIEYCKVLELLPGGEGLLLLSGVGWQEGLVGTATVGTGLDSQAGFTLYSEAPIIVDDLRQEKRFHGPALLFEHQVISGMSCIIRGTGGLPWGVLGAHSTRHVPFSEEDINFLVSVANILGDAIHRQRAEEALRASEERYRFIVENTSDGIWWIELTEPMPLSLSEEDQVDWYYKHAVLRQCNLGLARMYGYDSIEAVVGLPMRILMPREIPANIEVVRQFIRTGYRLVDAESRESGADGRELVFINNRVGVIENDRLVAEWGTNRDITERKQAEEALRASEALYRTIARSIPGGGVYVVDKDFRYLVAEGPVTEAFGLSREMLEGYTVSEVFPDERGVRMEERLRRTFTGELVDFETSFNGRVYWTQQAPLHDSIGQAIILTLDITERKQAEEALRQSEERFVRFMQHLPGLAWIKDTKGRYVYANAAVEKAFNVPQHELYGKTDEEIFPSEIAAQFRQNDARALAEEKGIQVIETLAHDDGVLHYSLVSKFPIPGPDGSTLLIGGTGFDITDRRQTEEALRESEERFSAILRQATAGIVRKDAEGRLIYVNEAFCQMLGYSEAELLGKTMSAFMYADDIQENQQLYQRLMREGTPFKLERRLLRRDGSVIWVDASVTPILDAAGRPQSAVTVEVDITGRKQAEDALRSSEQRYRNLFDLVPVAVYSCDADGLIDEYNHRSVELWGREPSRNDPNEKYCGSYKIFYPDGRFMPHASCPMARMLKGEALEPHELEILVERPDGGRRIVIAHPLPLKNERGEITGAINCLYDITERKQAEEALRDLNLQLETRVQQRTARLNDAIKSLRDEVAERRRVEDALRKSESAARENEEKLSTLFDLLPVGISFLSPGGRIIQMNSALASILKMTKEQLLGQKYKARSYIQSDGSPMMASDFASQRALTEGRTVYNVETGVVLEDGDVVWTSVSAAPVHVVDVGAVVVTVDVTENKRAGQALQESRERLQILSQRLVEVQEDERRAIARELHDRVGQTLAALNINLIIISGQLAGKVDEQTSTRLSDSMKLVAETIALVRDVMSNLRPSVLDDYGLEAAIESYLTQYTARYEIQANFVKPVPAISRLGPSIEMTFLRIAQEALMNSARHARASQVDLSLWQEDGAVCLTVQDNGQGIASWQNANRPGSHGLTIMRERAEAFGGHLQVSSVPGQGTRVEVRIPVETSDPSQGHS